MRRSSILAGAAVLAAALLPATSQAYNVGTWHWASSAYTTNINPWMVFAPDS
jgi:hypothetical protein